MALAMLATSCSVTVTPFVRLARTSLLGGCPPPPEPRPPLPGGPGAATAGLVGAQTEYLNPGAAAQTFGGADMAGLQGVIDAQAAQTWLAVFTFDSPAHARAWSAARVAHMCADGWVTLHAGIPAYATAAQGRDPAGQTVDIGYALRGDAALRAETVATPPTDPTPALARLLSGL